MLNGINIATIAVSKAIISDKNVKFGFILIIFKKHHKEVYVF